MKSESGNKKRLYLVCNAHLDPVWQWEWEEGAAAAISTFRAAADFCEEEDGYVFNHNEVILYKWVEEYEPALFERIKGLVAKGKWHIMGGWYLQPDCNMPSGESFIRQILLGRGYFVKAFQVRPTTAVNVDSFGHSRGLVQILEKAGYDSYLFMRPDHMPELPADDFFWQGYTGSRVMAHKIGGGYNSLMGKAAEKIKAWMSENNQKELGLVLWGVGNHGGGPSRKDLADIRSLMAQSPSHEIVHSTAESYFTELGKASGKKGLPVYEGDLNPRFVGCYTSLVRIKQLHRRLENELYMTEKMLSAAALSAGLNYPFQELNEALCDLMTAQFHDILPGSCIQAAEEASLRLLNHGLEIAARLKARAFFALSSGQPSARLSEYPILVYNPHPYPVKGFFECEFMLADQNWAEEFSLPVVYRDDVRLPSQPEKEGSNLNLDWRKRVVFEAELAPSSMNRFDCRIELLKSKPLPSLSEYKGTIIFETEELRVIINTLTGLIDEYSIRGRSYLKCGAFAPLAYYDNEDPWRMDTNTLGPAAGAFTLMSPGAGSDFSGVKDTLLPSVRIIEDGEVRTVVEAVFSYNHSFICQTYKLPKRGTEIEVSLRVYWNEKDKMLKLFIPTRLTESRYRGQTAFGIKDLAHDGQEVVAQKWTMLESIHEGQAVTLVNDGLYGSSSVDGAIYMSLLRGAGYCAHPIGDRPILVQDRFLPRMDQGERLYTFRLNAGPGEERLERIDREALVMNEKPYALSFFPSGDGKLLSPFLTLSDQVVQLSAFKKAEEGDDYILRLYEPTGSPRKTVVEIPSLALKKEVTLAGFEFKTYRLDTKKALLAEVEGIE